MLFNLFAARFFYKDFIVRKKKLAHNFWQVEEVIGVNSLNNLLIQVLTLHRI